MEPVGVLVVELHMQCCLWGVSKKTKCKKRMLPEISGCRNFTYKFLIWTEVPGGSPAVTRFSADNSCVCKIISSLLRLLEFGKEREARVSKTTQHKLVLILDLSVLSLLSGA